MLRVFEDFMSKIMPDSKEAKARHKKTTEVVEQSKEAREHSLRAVRDAYLSAGYAYGRRKTD